MISEHPDLQLTYDTIEQCLRKQNLTHSVFFILLKVQSIRSLNLKFF